MRNTEGPDRGAWATYAKRAREGAVPPINQSELARRLGVDRVTIYRWETGQQRPEKADTVKVFAQVLGLDLDEALAAAGLRPGVDVPTGPTREADEEEAIIRNNPTLSDEMKVQIIKLMRDRRERERQQRIADAQRMVELAGGKPDVD